MKFLGLLSFFLMISACKTSEQVNRSFPKVIVDKMNFQHNEHLTLTSIVDLAIAEDKLIFVDVYADWCSPCKMMDEDIFSDEDIANFMKENFVNYEVDGEKHNGPSLSLKYEVGGYPTLLILDQRGRVLERNDGALYHGGIRRMAKAAIKTSKKEI